MSKYAEAIESLGAIFKCHACDMEVANCMECDFLHDTCLEALQIADRVEQIWEEVKDKEFPHSMFQNCRDCGDYMQGTKDVLADIRGDAE